MDRPKPDISDLVARLVAEAETIGATRAAEFLRTAEDRIAAAAARAAAQPPGSADRTSPFIYHMA
jgi:hypothetical protein